MSGQQWAQSLAQLSNNQMQFFGGHPHSAVSSSQGASRNGGGQQWQNALSIVSMNRKPFDNMPYNSMAAQQWPHALNLMSQKSMQNYVAGKSAFTGPVWPAALNLLEDKWRQGDNRQLGAAMGDRNLWASANMANARNGTQWSQAIGVLANHMQQQMQQNQMLPWQPWPAQAQGYPAIGGQSSPMHQLPPRSLALLPEAVSISDTTSLHSKTSSELHVFHAARALYKAAQEGDVSEASRLLREGHANPDCRNPRGATPLFAAAFSNRAEIVRVLLAAQADPDRTNNDGVTPAFIAAQTDSRDALELLLRAGADSDRSRKDRATPVFIGAANNSCKALELLLRFHADPNLQNKNGDTPLTIAAHSSHYEAVQMLLNSNANVNAPGYMNQETALDCAYRESDCATSDHKKQRADAVKQLLLNAGARLRSEL